MSVTELKPEFYTLLVKFSSDLISTIDISGTYTYVSDSFTAILGYTPAELVGKTPFEFICTEDAREAQETLASITQHKQVVLEPFRFRHKDNSWRWIETTVTNMLEDPTIRGLVTNSRDVTEKVLTDLKQQKNKAYYSALFLNHPDLVFTLNIDGQIKNANDGVFKLTGYRKEDLEDSHFISFIKPASLQDTLKAFDKALHGEAFTFETTILHAAGQEINLSVTVVPVFLFGQVKGIQCIARDITEAKLANQRLAEHASQLANILEGITDPFIALDRQWRYSYVNRKATEFLNISQEELLGEVIWERFVPVRDTTFQKNCLQVAETGLPVEFDEFFPDFNATISFRIYRFEQGIAVQFKDTTAIKAAQQELQMLSLVASRTNSAVFISNSQHEIEWVNESFTTQTGYTLKEVVGKQPRQFLHGQGPDWQDISQIREIVARGENVCMELLCYTKSGDTLWVNVDITPTFDADHNLSKIIVIQTDISERKRSSLKLERLTNDLIKQNEDLQQFTYIVSHNLRAPVANVSGLTKLLQQTDPTTTVFREALLNLDKSASRLDTVIKDLNKILSLKRGSDSGKKEIVGLREICEEVSSSLQDTIDSTSATIDIKFGEEDAVAANRAYVYSILHNLLSNALKYRAPERPLHIRVKSAYTDDALTVYVSDNGLGINLEKVRQQIFTLYSRFHAHIEGKGFGLYLVKSQMEALGGSIEVESEVGKGTTFILKFSEKRHV